MLRLSVSLLALALSSAAYAADVCGRVQVDGRPLPFGFAHLSSDGDGGPDERSLARFSDGEFCLKDVKPGRYRLSVSPLGLLEPLRARFAGGEPTLDHPVVVAEKSLSIKIDYAPETPAPDWATVRGEVSGPVKDAPRLLDVWMRDKGHHLVWLKKGRGEFAVPVRPGHLGAVLVAGGGTAVARIEPPYAVRGGRSHEFTPAQTVHFTVELAPAARVRGRALLPDGKPFSPYTGARASERRLLALAVSSPFDGQQFEGYVASDGTFDFPAFPPGVWELQPVGSGPGFTWAAGTSRLVWTSTKAPATVDFPLAAPGLFSVPKDAVKLPALWQTEFAQHSPVVRRVMGQPSGAFDPRRTFGFFLEAQLPLSFNQALEQRWEPTVPGDPRLARVAPGSYDVYLGEIRRWQDYLSVRVLASRPALPLSDGKETALGFKPGDYLPLGDGEIRGALKSSIRWTLGDVRASKTLIDLDQTLFPVVNVYDEKKRFVGMSMPNIAMRDYHALGALLEAGDWKTIHEVYARLGEFRVQQLAPGRYTAQVVAFGYPVREYPVTVDGKKVVRLDVDLDRP